MSDENNRYNRNRNLWKKAYPVKKGKPRIHNITLSNGDTQSVNLETYQRDRSYYRIFPDQSNINVIPPAGSTLWEDGKYIVLNSPTPNLEYTITFNQNFPISPVVCLGIFAGSSSHPSAINPAIIDIQGSDTIGYPIGKPYIIGIGEPTTNSVTFRLSAPYQGPIHYFALGQTSSAIVPTNKNPLYFDNDVWWVSGGKQSVAVLSLSASILTWATLPPSVPLSNIKLLTTPFVNSASILEGVVVTPNSSGNTTEPLINEDIVTNRSTSSPVFYSNPLSPTYRVHYIAIGTL